MNFSIHLDNQTGRQLSRFAKMSGKTRNALIREAVTGLLASRSRAEWPREVRELAGAYRRLKPFESHRRSLKRTKKDPLA